MYDFYADLLTEKQKQFAELYFHDDLSLGEIAEEFRISRQAVYEHIKRSEILLEEYERKLQLYSKFEQRNNVFIDMEAIIKSNQSEAYETLMEKIALLRRIE